MIKNDPNGSLYREGSKGVIVPHKESDDVPTTNPSPRASSQPYNFNI